MNVWSCERRRKGQTMMEYLLMLALIVAAVIGIRGLMQGHMNNLYTENQKKVGTQVTNFTSMPAPQTAQ